MPSHHEKGKSRNGPSGKSRSNLPSNTTVSSSYPSSPSSRTEKSHTPSPPLPSTPVETKPLLEVNEPVSFTTLKPTSSPAEHPSSDTSFRLSLALITVIAFFTRFWKLNHPDEVVFDEVHFGKFASHYLERAFFFDVHPPLGKLLYVFVGWLVGYDGKFKFDNIGDSYITNNVPYIAYRSLPALLGTLTTPIVFLIMWESGYSLPASLVASLLLLFDNAHIAQSRLILLDSSLIFFMSLSVLCYVRFYKLRHVPFQRKWWKWLLLTGISLSCVISIKYVGVFTFLSIGVPVIIDLWNLLNINRRQGSLTLSQIGRHFIARAVGLIIVPFLLYLFWFQVHFAVLIKSGPGDNFMGTNFQKTLLDSPLSMNSIPIRYGDVITIRHKDTRVYLHSHFERYPLQYEDGRISSRGQQVTGYPHQDPNNHWQILPGVFNDPTSPTDHERSVKNGQLVRLRHLGTDSYLLSHDVASPYYPTNQEFTTVNWTQAFGPSSNDTLFQISVERGSPNANFETLSSQFKFIHYPSRVAMWTHTKPLPDWAFNQAEINGNKKVNQPSNLWYVEDIISLPEDHARRSKKVERPKPIPFWKKYFELQRAMFFHNNALTAEHPYASVPILWPFTLRGISFWTNSSSRQQIYFTGNPVGWWLATLSLTMFIGILTADRLALQRGIDALDRRTRSRFYDSTGFFFITWAAHYLPFFLMGRQLFLHHYLAAHLASCLVTGSLIEFIFCFEPVVPSIIVNTSTEKPGKLISKTSKVTITSTHGSRKPLRERIRSKGLTGAWCATTIVFLLVFATFFHFIPLTYGNISLLPKQVLSRQWLFFDLHFAK